MISRHLVIFTGDLVTFDNARNNLAKQNTGNIASDMNKLISKLCYGLGSCMASTSKRRIELYGWTGISIVEEVWLMLYEDTQCTLEGRRRTKSAEKRNFMLTFLLSCLKMWILFHHYHFSK